MDNLKIGDKVSFINIANVKGIVTNITQNENNKVKIYWINGRYMFKREELQKI